MPPEYRGPMTPTRELLSHDSDFETAATRLKEWYLFSLTEMKKVELIDSDGEQELIVVYDALLEDELVIRLFSKKWNINRGQGILKDGFYPVDFCLIEAINTACNQIRGANENREHGIPSNVIDFGGRSIKEIDTLVDYGLAIIPILDKEYKPLMVGDEL